MLKQNVKAFQSRFLEQQRSTFKKKIKASENTCLTYNFRLFYINYCILITGILITYGSGVYIGLELWRMYCVAKKTRKASPAKKSRDDIRPATGRSRKPVQSVERMCLQL